MVSPTSRHAKLQERLCGHIRDIRIYAQPKTRYWFLFQRRTHKMKRGRAFQDSESRMLGETNGMTKWGAGSLCSLQKHSTGTGSVLRKTFLGRG